MKHFSTIFIFVLLFSLTLTLSAQVNWTKDTPNNPVFTPGSSGEWDDYSLWQACILYDSSTYHMWYGGHDGTTTRIGYATSPDGITWTRYAGNPVLDVGEPGSWEDDGLGSPYVMFDGSIYHMWYGGGDGTYTRIGYATSPDRVTWTKHPANPIMGSGTAGSWEEMGVWDPCVLLEDNTYHMWYDGWSVSETGSVGYATSPDGINWTPYEGNPVLTPAPGYWETQRVECPEVFFDGSVYHMWYTGGTTTFWWNWKGIGYATSADGITWTKYESNPVLKMDAGSWDSQWVGFCRVLWDSTTSQFQMWYGGGSGDWYAKLGYATAPLNIYVPGDYATIQGAIDAAHDGNVVLVDEGTYYENINFKGKKITVASRYLVDQVTSHISRTIIDGSQHSNPDSGSVVYFVSAEDTNSVLSGFTITGGSGTHWIWEDLEMRAGGGINITFSGAKIIHNKIMNNSININEENLYCHGGGIGALGSEGSTIIISDNEIRNNIVKAWWGGGAGIVMGTAGKILFARNIVASNIYNSSNVTGGGGFYIWADNDYAGEIILNSNLIKNNESHGSSNNGYGYGGGVYIESCNPELTNNIITGNISGEGGGVNISTWPNGLKAKSIFINNTITKNKARRGGAIFIKDSEAIILNTIMWDNQATVTLREIYTTGSTLNVFYSDIAGGFSGETNLDTDPGFSDTLFHLADSSLCIGRGISSLEIGGVWYHSPGTDFEGQERPYLSADEYVDIGALESPYEKVTIDNIPEYDGKLPLKYELSQNYPNPFNPSTNIEFALAKSENVELKVYNILGKEVATLVSIKLNQGNHSYTFDGKNLASGIYYYQLLAGDYREVKKMILLK